MEDGKCFFIKAQKQKGSFKPFFMKKKVFKFCKVHEFSWLENYFTKMIGGMKLIFRTIDTDKDKDTIIKFRKDSYVVSFGTEAGFGDEHAYLQRMEERVRKFPDGQVILEKDQEPIGQMELQIREYEGIEIGYVNLFYLIPEYRSKGLGKKLP